MYPTESPNSGAAKSEEQPQLFSLWSCLCKPDHCERSATKNVGGNTQHPPHGMDDENFQLITKRINSNVLATVCVCAGGWAICTVSCSLSNKKLFKNHRQ